MPVIVVPCARAAVPERGFAPPGADRPLGPPPTGEKSLLRPWDRVPPQALAPRLARLPTIAVLGRRVPVALGVRARLLGLSHLDRELAGGGLLIPRCSSVHTFGMRFEVDVWFLDRRGGAIDVRRALGARRLASCRGAAAVLEVPSGLDAGPP
jgi:uncharacterized protein